MCTSSAFIILAIVSSLQAGYNRYMQVMRKTAECFLNDLLINDPGSVPASHPVPVQLHLLGPSLWNLPNRQEAAHQGSLVQVCIPIPIGMPGDLRDCDSLQIHIPYLRHFAGLLHNSM